jgi:hypothetical protein
VVPGRTWLPGSIVPTLIFYQRTDQGAVGSQIDQKMKLNVFAALCSMFLLFNCVKGQIVTENYISGWFSVIIKDADYYKRQDKISKQEFENNLEIVKKAKDYYDKQDWASAVYYGKRIQHTEYFEINNIKHFVVTTSYFYLNDVENSKKWYAFSQKKVDPETMRNIDSAIKSSNMDTKIQKHDSDLEQTRKHKTHKIALIAGVVASAISITVLAFIRFAG